MRFARASALALAALAASSGVRAAAWVPPDPGARAAIITGSFSGSIGSCATTFSMSTSVSHGRSVSPFHCDVFAFSYRRLRAGRRPFS